MGRTWGLKMKDGEENYVDGKRQLRITTITLG